MQARILVIGGGFGGLEAAFTLRELLGNSAAVTLLDRSAGHSFIPSIHEIISGRTDPGRIRVPLAAMLGPAGIGFVRDEALSVDTGKRRVLCRERSLPYDYLIVSTGAESNFFGIPGADTISFRFRTPEDAVRIRAELERILREAGRVRIVLAGGGTEGMEVAGEVADSIRRNGREDDLRGGWVALEVIEGRGRILHGYPDAARVSAEQALAGRGIGILTESRISSVEKDRLFLSTGKDIAFSLLIWTGGIKPSPLLERIPLPKDRDGWLSVTAHLDSPADGRVFGIGDAARVEGSAEGGLRLAFHAQDQGTVAALNVSAAISGRKPVAYEAREKAQLVSIGGDFGILIRGRRVMTGPWVIGLKKAVERRHLLACLSRPVASRAFSLLPGKRLVHRVLLQAPF